VKAILRAVLSASFDLEPAPNAGFELAAGAAAGPLSLELSASSSFAASSHDIPGRTGTGGAFRPFAAGASVCGAFLDARLLRAGGCAGFEYQRIEATGYGVRKPGSGSADWVAPALAPFLGVKLSRVFSLVARLEAAAPLRQPTYTLAHVGPVYQVAPVSLRIGAGVEVRF
jgi:hypothetical protein